MPFRNVFQIWLDGDRKLPFAVRNASHNWHPRTFYVVRKVEISPKNWEYYEKNGRLYGKAWGDFYLRDELSQKDVPVNLAGTYEWVLMEEIP